MNTRWQPSAPIENLHQRSEILWKIREFFRDREICEVQTPVVGSNTVTDLHIESVRLANGYFLQTSPEYFLKRLLVAGMSSCYQLGPVFRDDEVGRWHNPEFTMLEWYRVGYTTSELRREVAELVALAIGLGEIKEFTFREFLSQQFQLDCFECSDEELASVAQELGHINESRRADVLDFLYSTAIARMSDSRYFVLDFPTGSSALAEIREIDGHHVADRFELIVDGLEIANGYGELRDPVELNRRMGQDQKLRQQFDRLKIEKDQRLLAAMEAGLPKCSGVAIGFDRLVALSVGADSIQSVLSFAQNRL